MPNTSQSLDHIDAAAQVAYTAVAQEKGLDPDEVHRMRLCHAVSKLMVEGLVGLEPNARQDTRGGWTVDEHSYVDIRPGEEGDLIADPTWQQFFDKGKLPANSPRVLVGSRDSVIDRLRSHGLDDLTLELWKRQD